MSTHTPSTTRLGGSEGGGKVEDVNTGQPEERACLRSVYGEGSDSQTCRETPERQLTTEDSKVRASLRSVYGTISDRQTCRGTPESQLTTEDSKVRASLRSVYGTISDRQTCRGTLESRLTTEDSKVRASLRAVYETISDRDTCRETPERQLTSNHSEVRRLMDDILDRCCCWEEGGPVRGRLSEEDGVCGDREPVGEGHGAGRGGDGGCGGGLLEDASGPGTLQGDPTLNPRDDVKPGHPGPDPTLTPRDDVKPGHPGPGTLQSDPPTLTPRDDVKPGHPGPGTLQSDPPTLTPSDDVKPGHLKGGGQDPVGVEDSTRDPPTANDTRAQGLGAHLQTEESPLEVGVAVLDRGMLSRSSVEVTGLEVVEEVCGDVTLLVFSGCDVRTARPTVGLWCPRFDNVCLSLPVPAAWMTPTTLNPTSTSALTSALTPAAQMLLHSLTAVHATRRLQPVTEETSLPWSEDAPSARASLPSSSHVFPSGRPRVGTSEAERGRRERTVGTGQAVRAVLSVLQGGGAAAQDLTSCLSRLTRDDALPAEIVSRERSARLPSDVRLVASLRLHSPRMTLSTLLTSLQMRPDHVGAVDDVTRDDVEVLRAVNRLLHAEPPGGPVSTEEDEKDVPASRRAGGGRRGRQQAGGGPSPSPSPLTPATSHVDCRPHSGSWASSGSGDSVGSPGSSPSSPDPPSSPDSPSGSSPSSDPSTSTSSTATTSAGLSDADSPSPAPARPTKAQRPPAAESAPSRAPSRAALDGGGSDYTDRHPSDSAARSSPWLSGSDSGQSVGVGVGGDGRQTASVRLLPTRHRVGVGSSYAETYPSDSESQQLRYFAIPPRPSSSGTVGSVAGVLGPETRDCGSLTAPSASLARKQAWGCGPGGDSFLALDVSSDSASDSSVIVGEEEYFTVHTDESLGGQPGEPCVGQPEKSLGGKSSEEDVCDGKADESCSAHSDESDVEQSEDSCARPTDETRKSKQGPGTEEPAAGSRDEPRGDGAVKAGRTASGRERLELHVKNYVAGIILKAQLQLRCGLGSCGSGGPGGPDAWHRDLAALEVLRATTRGDDGHGADLRSCDLTGDLDEDLTGDLTGDLSGDLTDDLHEDLDNGFSVDSTGNFNEESNGDLNDDITEDLNEDLNGDLSGDLTGDLSNDCQVDDGARIPGMDGEGCRALDLSVEKVRWATEEDPAVSLLSLASLDTSLQSLGFFSCDEATPKRGDLDLSTRAGRLRVLSQAADANLPVEQTDDGLAEPEPFAVQPKTLPELQETPRITSEWEMTPELGTRPGVDSMHELEIMPVPEVMPEPEMMPEPNKMPEPEVFKSGIPPESENRPESEIPSSSAPCPASDYKELTFEASASKESEPTTTEAHVSRDAKKLKDTATESKGNNTELIFTRARKQGKLAEVPRLTSLIEKMLLQERKPSSLKPLESTYQPPPTSSKQEESSGKTTSTSFKQAKMTEQNNLTPIKQKPSSELTTSTTAIPRHLTVRPKIRSPLFRQARALSPPPRSPQGRRVKDAWLGSGPRTPPWACRSQDVLEVPHAPVTHRADRRALLARRHTLAVAEVTSDHRAPPVKADLLRAVSVHVPGLAPCLRLSALSPDLQESPLFETVDETPRAELEEVSDFSSSFGRRQTARTVPHTAGEVASSPESKAFAKTSFYSTSNEQKQAPDTPSLSRARGCEGAEFVVSDPTTCSSCNDSDFESVAQPAQSARDEESVQFETGQRKFKVSRKKSGSVEAHLEVMLGGEDDVSTTTDSNVCQEDDGARIPGMDGEGCRPLDLSVEKVRWATEEDPAASLLSLASLDTSLQSLGFFSCDEATPKRSDLDLSARAGRLRVLSQAADANLPAEQTDDGLVEPKPFAVQPMTLPELQETPRVSAEWEMAPGLGTRPGVDSMHELEIMPQTEMMPEPEEFQPGILRSSKNRPGSENRSSPTPDLVSDYKELNFVASASKESKPTTTEAHFEPDVKKLKVTATKSEILPKGNNTELIFRRTREQEPLAEVPRLTSLIEKMLSQERKHTSLKRLELTFQPPPTSSKQEESSGKATSTSFKQAEMTGQNNLTPTKQKSSSELTTAITAIPRHLKVTSKPRSPLLRQARAASPPPRSPQGRRVKDAWLGSGPRTPPWACRSQDVLEVPHAPVTHRADRRALLARRHTLAVAEVTSDLRAPPDLLRAVSVHVPGLAPCLRLSALSPDLQESPLFETVDETPRAALEEESDFSLSFGRRQTARTVPHSAGKVASSPESKAFAKTSFYSTSDEQKQAPRTPLLSRARGYEGVEFERSAVGNVSVPPFKTARLEPVSTPHAGHCIEESFQTDRNVYSGSAHLVPGCMLKEYRSAAKTCDRMVHVSDNISAQTNSVRIFGNAMTGESDRRKTTKEASAKTESPKGSLDQPRTVSSDRTPGKPARPTLRFSPKQSSTPAFIFNAAEHLNRLLKTRLTTPKGHATTSTTTTTTTTTASQQPLLAARDGQPEVCGRGSEVEQDGHGTEDGDPRVASLTQEDDPMASSLSEVHGPIVTSSAEVKDLHLTSISKKEGPLVTASSKEDGPCVTASSKEDDRRVTLLSEDYQHVTDLSKEPKVSGISIETDQGSCRYSVCITSAEEPRVCGSDNLVRRSKYDDAKPSFAECDDLRRAGPQTHGTEGEKSQHDDGQQSDIVCDKARRFDWVRGTTDQENIGVGGYEKSDSSDDPYQDRFKQAAGDSSGSRPASAPTSPDTAASQEDVSPPMANQTAQVNLNPNRKRKFAVLEIDWRRVAEDQSRSSTNQDFLTSASRAEDNEEEPSQASGQPLKEAHGQLESKESTKPKMDNMENERTDLTTEGSIHSNKPTAAREKECPEFTAEMGHRSTRLQIPCSRGSAPTRLLQRNAAPVVVAPWKRGQQDHCGTALHTPARESAPGGGAGGRRVSVVNTRQRRLTPATPGVQALLLSPDRGVLEALAPLRGMPALTPPLYMVHQITGSVKALKSLASQLAVPCIGVRQTDLTPDTSVEAMARFYCQAVSQHNRSGSFRLAGYSYGGLIAFEMARQLQRDGKQVELLLMLDGSPHYVKRQTQFAQRRRPPDTKTSSTVIDRNNNNSNGLPQTSGTNDLTTNTNTTVATSISVSANVNNNNALTSPPKKTTTKDSKITPTLTFSDTSTTTTTTTTTTSNTTTTNNNDNDDKVTSPLTAAERSESLKVNGLLYFIQLYVPVPDRPLLAAMLRQMPSLQDKVEAAVGVTMATVQVSATPARGHWLNLKSKVGVGRQRAKVSVGHVADDVISLTRQQKALQFLQAVRIADRFDIAAGGPFNGDVCLVRIKTLPPHCGLLGADYGLASLCTGAVRIRYVDGGHDTMMQAPHVDAVAREVASLLPPASP